MNKFNKEVRDTYYLILSRLYDRPSLLNLVQDTRPSVLKFVMMEVCKRLKDSHTDLTEARKTIRSLEDGIDTLQKQLNQYEAMANGIRAIKNFIEFEQQQEQEENDDEEYD